jgi:hypothetical protein
MNSSLYHITEPSVAAKSTKHSFNPQNFSISPKKNDEAVSQVSQPRSEVKRTLRI